MIRKLIILTLINSTVQLTCFGQADSLNIENPAFSSMLILDDNLYALDKEGLLSIWNLSTLEKVFKSIDTSTNFTAITKDNNNKIFLGTNKGKIFKFNSDNFSIKIHIELKKRFHISDIFFNSANEIFLMVPYAIYDPVSDKYWDNFIHESNGMIVQKRFLFFFRKQIHKYFDMPQYTYIDSKDRIWMIKSYGEFGGLLQIFDTNKRKELNANINNINFGLFCPKSVFEDDKQNIYITSGLQHFTNSGDIFKIKGESASIIYSSEMFKDTSDINKSSSGIFVGPGAYNSFEEMIYFATTDGFYRAMVSKTGELNKPELFFKPKLLWEREPLAIGVAMTVKKIDFTSDNRLVFLTSNNGIGIYDGLEIKMLK